MPRKDNCSPEVYERVLAGNRARQKTAHGAKNHANAVRAYRNRHRLKQVAHDAVMYAVRLGKLVAWPVCAVPECNTAEVQGHHADYANHLGVTWLCDSHHKEVHAMVKA